ncbi:hypothetical protein CONLIGDRAFT_111078 [Coniochaeta ligniaria NRRL 30616]|uniref:Copper acquisition factor BIM1-like domain-containing protein n=1 Tax=Coniochaeta ligniaria NRRL 30616 TaxID=1408157 RepID=A0A1J7J8I5_9PEZI|nr:hypothetical protein CONLIGDRAFT_111078 [Coniochaeta ligniaria NRRL 30616]
MALSTLALIVTAQLASAHFAIEYPEWRADSLTNDSYSQYTWPSSSGNRTDWPLTGGSLKLDLHHPWTYVFVNLGIGENVTNFNYTLTQNFWNETGNGTLCVPTLPLPANLAVTDGTQASIQVVTLGDKGNALYNCADITFRATAAALNSSECTTDSGVSYFAVSQEVNGSTSSGGSTGGSTGDNSSNSTTGGSGKNAAAATGINMTALSSVVGLALAFVFALSV